MKQQYLLMVEGGGLPRVLHTDSNKAKIEAERLVRAYQKPVTVFAVHKVCRPMQVPIEWETVIMIDTDDQK